MKRLLKYTSYTFLVLLIVAIVVIIFFYAKWNLASKSNMNLLGEEALTLVVDGFEYRDLNKNGSLDVYEDTRASTEERVENLLSQLNLEEKAGLMFITMAGMNHDGSLNEMVTLKDPLTLMLESNSSMIARKKMNHFNLLQATSPKAMAIWNNNIQKLSEIMSLIT